MRIVLDMQGAQTQSRFRGIGRYTRAFTRAVLQQRGEHEVILALSGVHSNSVADVKEAFTGLLPDDCIRVWAEPGPTFAQRGGMADSPSGRARRQAIESLREGFLASLNPDVIHVSSLFEGEDAAASIGQFDTATPVTAMLYDLIPLVDEATYLAPNPAFRAHYLRQLEFAAKARALFAISEFTQAEALTFRDRLPVDVHAISTAVEADFRARPMDEVSRAHFLSRYGILRSFVLYTGGGDPRKNLPRLIEAYAQLPAATRAKHQLVLCGALDEGAMLAHAAEAGLSTHELVLTGHVPDVDLIGLYTHCALFVFPSWREGFGLPPLEAMACGAPVITSNRSSLPEVVGLAEALFDPFDVPSITGAIQAALEDPTFAARLRANAEERSALFSWEVTAQRAWAHWESLVDAAAASQSKSPQTRPTPTDLVHHIGALLARAGDVSADEVRVLARCIEHNEAAAGVEVPVPEADAGPAVQSTGPAATTAPAAPATPRDPGAFDRVVPDHSKVPGPYVFTSMLCRQQHFHLPLHTYWCRRLAEPPRFHRKQWEWVYICQALHERGFLRPGKSAVGFGVGREPMVSYLASCGLRVLATDLAREEAAKYGWVQTDQHSDEIRALNERRLCEPEAFLERASFRSVDMNAIPSDLGSFDICWSSCSLEHLGSIRKGMDFVLKSSQLLAPGGIAIHTTEFNLTSNTHTLDNNPYFVLFRQADILALVQELEAQGFEVEPVDFSAGDDELERYIDMPPYLDEPHLRLELGGEFVSTSIGLIIRAPLSAGV